MKSLILFAGFALLFTGCQTVPYQGEARDVKLKPRKEGTIALPSSPRDEDRQKAQSRMQQNCNPLAYEVMEEGEVVVGQKTDATNRETNRASSEAQVGSLFGIPVMSGEAAGTDSRTSAVTTALKEWHIQYRCLAQNKASLK